jgi:hypothetical protein
MADYKQSGNRYTAIFVIESSKGGQDFYRRNPFDLVRFNVDTNPSAPQEIVPIGQVKGNLGIGDTPLSETDKIYEKVWIVETAPWHPGRGGKQDFGKSHTD